MSVLYIIRHRIFPLLMPLITLFILTLSGAIALRRGEQDDLHKFENRMENSFPDWYFESWKEGKYQEQFTEALSDRLPCSVKTKIWHFHWRNPLLLSLQKKVYSFSDYYVNFRNNQFLYGDSGHLYLMNDTYSLANDPNNSISEWAECIQSAMKSHSNIPLFLYYVSSEKDVRLDNGYREPNFQAITSIIPIQQSHASYLYIKDFEQYRRFFYQTDHHWQCFGSYQGYQDVFKLLGLDSQGESLACPVEPSEGIIGMPDEDPPSLSFGVHSVLVSRKHHESKARDTGTENLFSGKIYMYCFDYAPIQIFKDGEAVQVGNEDLVLCNQDPAFENSLRYSTIYGDDFGELVFETQRKDRPNILVIGDSYDNAILKLLAGHFHHIYSVDLRHYSEQKGKSFRMSEYIKENDVNQVLIIGSWIMFHKKLYEPPTGE